MADATTLEEDEVFEMANLSRTGIAGVIYVSTCGGRHGPHVKYYERAGGDQPSGVHSRATESGRQQLVG